MLARLLFLSCGVRFCTLLELEIVRISKITILIVCCVIVCVVVRVHRWMELLTGRLCDPVECEALGLPTVLRSNDGPRI